MSRKKSLTEQESERLRSSSDLWERVGIEKTGMPECIDGIPKNKVHAVYASASSTPVIDSSGRVVHGGLVSICRVLIGGGSRKQLMMSR
jgi:hypothetical protein